MNLQINGWELLLPQSAIPPVPDLFLRIHGLQAAPKKKGTAVQ